MTDLTAWLTPGEAEALWLSLKTGVVGTAFSLPPGIAVAWLLARRNIPGKLALDGLVHLPLVLPPVVTGYVLLVLFGHNGLLGRWIEAHFGKLTVASLYLPSGSASEEAQARKDQFLDTFMPMMKKWHKQGRQMIICGDWNIAHKEIDIRNWKGNLKNSGFLPHERAWLTTLFDEVGWVDAFRVVNQEPDQYTWWSNRGQAYARNVGWRIDYHIVSPDLKAKIRSTSSGPAILAISFSSFGPTPERVRISAKSGNRIEGRMRAI